MNILRKYLTDNELTQEEFGAKFAPPVTQGLVHQWLNFLDGKKKGATRITPERAVEMEQITGGLVPRHATCKLFAQPRAARTARAAA